MKKILFVVLAVLLDVYCCLASEEGTQKAQELRSRMLEHPDGIIQFTAEDYEHYVLNEPRPYDVVVFLTSYSCKICAETYESLKEAASAYKEAKAIYPAKEGENVKRSVFFANMYYYDYSKPYFNQLKVERVPDILVSLPKMARFRTDAHRDEYVKKYMLDVGRSSVHVGPGKILEYVNERVGRNVEHKEPIVKLFYVLALLGLPVMALIKIYLKYRSFFNHPKFWLAGSYTLYFVCMSGLVYCIIHGSAWTTTDKEGEVQWYSHGSRSQLGMEGWVMSGSILLSGLLLLVIQYVGLLTNDSRLTKILFFAITICAAYWMMMWVEDIYKKKGGWYNPIFYPPGHYVKGGLMRDQGNTV